jgi:CubicO group peptidase (beta-lactamase class C family)
MLYSSSVLSFVLFAVGIQAGCYDPSPAFVLPKFRTYNESVILKDAFKEITANLNKLISQPAYDNYSFSVEVTTSENSLWELHHTARDKDSARPGVKEVNSDSVYRVASITKAFTTLAIIQQHIAGNLSIDDTIDQYLDLKGDIPWEDITLRTVASQLSGIPRECKI